MPIISSNFILSTWPNQLSKNARYCMALSGGVDSVVLLHLFYALQQTCPLKLTAVHINHGLSPHANEWAKLCQNLCIQLAIPLQIKQLRVQKQGGMGLENTARQLRYKIYAQNNADIIILAHHQDDQIETLLSQLMRGSNIHNLASMRPFNYGYGKLLWRPLLNIYKKHIIDYAKLYQLPYVVDESNQNNIYLRNFLRNQIIPQLQQFDNQVKGKLHNSLQTIQEAGALNDMLAQQDLAACCNERQQIIRALYCYFDQLRQINLLAYYIKLYNLPLPSRKQLNEFNLQINTARFERIPSLKLTCTMTIVCQQSVIFLTNS